ncbi:MAG: hypothetical protein GXO47_06780 [Chlorobi bacterium]|nr:hypothetical protein [Chlorobiota bacterium]
MKEIIDIPAVIAGREVFGKDNITKHEGISGSVTIRTPEITKDRLNDIFEHEKAVNTLPINEIISFIEEVGKKWADPDYPLKKEALEIMMHVTQFSKKELLEDFGNIPLVMSRETFIDKVMATEFGGTDMLDNWVVRGGCEVKAVPRGSFLHILAGNVPGVEMVSLIRGLLTKNLNILKTAGANPVTPYYLLKSFMEIDPEHPLTRSISAFHWKRGSEIEKHIYKRVSSACVWGGSDAVYAAWRHARPGLEILDYGPKRSMVFIGKKTLNDNNKLHEAAHALAKDTTIHDQQACHSPQVVFVEGETDKFCENLASELTKFAKEYPRGGESLDRQSERSHLRMMHELSGNKVYHPGSHDWTLIVTKDFTATAQSPLGRTLFVIPVDSLGDAVKYADHYTMVAAFSDREDLNKYRDELAMQGVDRLTDVGRMGLLPADTPHEGRYDLSRLVKFVSTDR